MSIKVGVLNSQSTVIPGSSMQPPALFEGEENIM